MIGGLLIGLLLGSLIGMLLFAGTDSILSFFISLILFVSISISIGIKVDQVAYNKKIANWKNTKLVIESSIKDKSLDQLEKANLVKTIVEYNMQLTELKEDVKQWWYFHLDDSKVNELDIITIETED